jgi:hypothetical protein
LFSGHSNGKLKIWNFNQKTNKLDESFDIYESNSCIHSIKKLNDFLIFRNENEMIVGRFENGVFEEIQKINEIGNFDLISMKDEKEEGTYLLIGNENV